ncbi:hypothetical protein [Microbulbifer sp. ARAS458-1]|uniref:hypothetical protein n=1 Tax=Microbulbifer sp. ARAS458-1 TaxID=3140242 RepID=UPI0038780BDE
MTDQTIKLAANPLVLALLQDMSAALDHIENGNYGDAHAILEGRCRPSDPLKKLTACSSVAIRRTEKEIVALMPPEMFTQGDAYSISIAAGAAASQLSVPISQLNCGDLLSVQEILAELGALLVIARED